ncbi:MAG: NAD(P)-binding domain-containing protein [Candidatus Thiodiazotropha sp. L084R]
MKVTLLGLGLMGLPIAHRLVQRGHEVTAWNRSGERLQVAAAEGIDIQPDLAQAVA